MTDREREQHIADLNAAVNQLEFRVHLGAAVMTRLRQEFWLFNVVFFLLGAIVGAAFYDWMCPS